MTASGSTNCFLLKSIYRGLELQGQELAPSSGQRLTQARRPWSGWQHSQGQADGITGIFTMALETSGSRFHNSFTHTQSCILFKIYITSGVVVQVCQAHVWKSGDRTTLRSHFSLSTFVWVLGTKLRLLELHGKYMYLLSHLTSQNQGLTFLGRLNLTDSVEVKIWFLMYKQYLKPQTDHMLRVLNH